MLRMPETLPLLEMPKKIRINQAIGHEAKNRDDENE